MDASEPNWAAELAAAQAWWREAGVDTAFADAPRDWLAEGRPERPAVEAPAVPAAVAPPPTRPKLGGDRARWPATLAEFEAWWLTEPTLDPEPAARRVPPAGPEGAALMVLVPMPEDDDRTELLAGPQGRLLDAMLRAFGTSREETRVASLLPRRTPAADGPALAAAGWSEIVAHHVALAAPRRLLVLGRDLSPLLGHDPAQGAAILPVFNHDRGSVPLAIAPSLEGLLKTPALKRGVGTRWLEWTGPDGEEPPASG